MVIFLVLTLIVFFIFLTYFLISFRKNYKILIVGIPIILFSLASMYITYDTILGIASYKSIPKDSILRNYVVDEELINIYVIVSPLKDSTIYKMYKIKYTEKDNEKLGKAMDGIETEGKTILLQGNFSEFNNEDNVTVYEYDFTEKLKK